MPQVDCEICGNPIRVGAAVCPYCGQRQEGGGGGAGGGVDRYLVCNIKEGMPLVEEAEARLRREVERARAGGAKVLTVIHGYGSSGRGGGIREAARTLLRGMVASGRAREVVYGEDFGEGSSLVQRFPKLREHRDLGRGNAGVTLVVL